MTNSLKDPIAPLQTNNGGSIAIAVIDDTEENLYTLSRYLRRAGFEVWEGHNGADALRLASQLPKLIILDVKLPDMIGYEVCRKIKSNPATAHIPVVHTSATYVQSEDRMEGMEGGADAYFTSPIKPSELIATARALVRVHDAEEKADVAAGQWRAAFDAISSAACLINGRGVIERCNSVLAAVAGKPREAIEGVSFLEFASTGVMSPVPYLRLRETQQRETLELQERNRWWQVTADPLYDESGGWNGAICILVDISERKRADAQRRRSERVLSEFFENAPIGLYWMDGEGTILRINRAALEMIGYSAEECLGGKVDAFHPAAGEVEELLAQLQRGGAAFEHETRLRCKDGSIKDVMVSCNGVWEDGSLVHIHCFLRDITESKRASNELAQARSDLQKHAGMLEREVADRTVELEHTVRAMESYSASIAHDLRAPLRAMDGYSTALLSDDFGTLNEEGREIARRISAAARRMDQLILGLLEYGRLSHASLPLESVEVGDLVEGLVRELPEMVSTKEYAVEVDESLPVVRANRLLLRQVFQHLLTNAIRFVAPDVAPKIEVRAEDRGPVARISIRDNGIGINPDYHDRIFKICQRLHKEGDYEGTGIGLAIVEKGMQKMGGRVGVESAKGEGSTFWIELPKE